MSRTYSITDLDGCANMMRTNAMVELSNGSTQDNPDDYISLGQAKSLLEQYSIGKDESGQLIINDKTFDDVYTHICNIITGVGLAKLASEGLVNVCFNDKTNEFEFIGAKDHKTTKKKMKTKKKKKPDVDKDDE